MMNNTFLQTFGYTQEERINLYCYYNMRKHYFSSFAIFKSFNEFFHNLFAEETNVHVFLNLGLDDAAA